MNTKIIFPDKWNNANPDKSTIEEMYLPNRMKLLGFSDAAIKKVENFMFSKNEKDADIESGAIVNVILEEFYDNETPVLERYYKLLMILDDDFLCAEDIAGIEDEILKIRKLAELECYVESEAYLTEDEKMIYGILSKNRLKSMGEIAPYVSFGRSKTTKLLKEMEEKGIITVEGKGRSTKYSIK